MLLLCLRNSQQDMNFLSCCVSNVRKVRPYCQNAVKSIQLLNVNIGQKEIPFNVGRSPWSSTFFDEINQTVSEGILWTQIRTLASKSASEPPTLHGDIKFPNYDNYRKQEYIDKRKTTWFKSKEKIGAVYVLGIFGWIFGAYAVKGHGMHYVSYFGAAKDVLAMASIEVDLTKVVPGTCMSVKWRGKPLFVKNRTPREIEVEAATDIRTLRDPQSPEQRVQKQEWLIVIGICTHLGCVPMPNNGDFVGGFYCPCHGSHFDNLGRARKGPAPSNLVVPPHVFTSDTIVLIG